MAHMSFLFRFDGARDNDDFMTLRGERHGGRVYSGTPLKVGPGSGWIPDFLEVTVNKGARSIELTLIELEATEIVARASCRKYLPESSTAILEAFHRYIDTVLVECRTRADPRLSVFRELKAMLECPLTVTVQTAGALRTSAELLEVLSLSDQPSRPIVAADAANPEVQVSFVFSGRRRMTRSEIDGLRRVVRILHAVVADQDHCGGTLKTWRNLRRKPLDMAIRHEAARFPELSRLIAFTAQSGATVDSERVVCELQDLWSGVGRSTERESIRKWIKDFHPIALAFPGHAMMQAVFEQAREIIEGTA